VEELLQLLICPPLKKKGWKKRGRGGGRKKGKRRGKGGLSRFTGKRQEGGNGGEKGEGGRGKELPVPLVEFFEHSQENMGRKEKKRGKRKAIRSPLGKKKTRREGKKEKKRKGNPFKKKGRGSVKKEKEGGRQPFFNLHF